jgi:hypothetical protein
LVFVLGSDVVFLGVTVLFTGAVDLGLEDLGFVLI